MKQLDIEPSFYHISSELGVEVSLRLQLQEENYFKNILSKFDNCGTMSPMDVIRDSHLTEKRVLNFINELSDKVLSLEIDSLVSIPFISESLRIPEETIISLLRKNGIELTTVEEEF